MTGGTFRVRLTQADGADCCVRLTTTCEVKLVKVNVNNGTIGSVDWNCGSLPGIHNGSLDATLLPKGNDFIRLVSDREMKVKPVVFP
jgi:hypothetical protein